MFINYTLTKKLLEILIKLTYSKFGNIITSSILDSIKLLGFFYATNAAISINIEDLKIPKLKTQLIQQTLSTNLQIKEQWKQGLLTELERYQSTIDIWNNVTNILKDKIIYYYKTFDPLNNLYIMAFSGARGNISQVRQLVGMRGLMSDQDGKIIDLPILSNFREGLSLVDYIISAYGARKGIVDTALKTADSGYLTRRLIYGAQDLIIRLIDCKSTNGIYILASKTNNLSNIIGRYCILINSNQYPFVSILHKEILLTSNILNKIIRYNQFYLKIRSIITCKGLKGICQKCYGWDLTSEQLISLGSTVGIIAAQSIGEPGTQLTMRTFHTGGIFTGESVQEIISPFSGTLENLNKIKIIHFRTNHGLKILALKNKTLLTIKNWQNINKHIYLEKGTLLYNNNFKYIIKNQLIAQIAIQNLVSDKRKLKPLYTSISGKCYIKNAYLYYCNNLIFTLKDILFWILSENFYNIPLNSRYLYKNKIFTNKKFSYTKVISPINGIIKINKTNIIILNTLFKFELDLSLFTKKLSNYLIKNTIILRNIQYIDQYTILSYNYLYPLTTSKTYKLKQKFTKKNRIITLLSINNIFILYSEQIKNYFNNLNTFIIFNKKQFNLTSQYNFSGILYKKNGYTQIIQKAIPNFLNKGTILKFTNNNYIKSNQNFALLLNYIQQTEDIVQGLPKIEELIEAQIPKKQNYLLHKSGVYLEHSDIKHIQINSLNTNKLQISYINTEINLNVFPYFQLSHFFNKNLINFNHSFYNYTYFTFINKPLLINFNKENLYIFNTLNHHKDMSLTFWKKYKLISKSNNINVFTKVYNLNFPAFNIIYKNLTQNNIIIANSNLTQYLYLYDNESLNTLLIDFNINNIYKSGIYNHINDTLTDGNINIHNLLNIIYLYHYKLDDILKSVTKSLNKFQLILINSLQAIYTSQGVTISSKHFEIIINQLTTRVVIYNNGNTPFFNGEIINLTLLIEIINILKINNHNKINFIKLPKFFPKIQAITQSAFTKDGFISAAGFQSTRSTLIKAAIEGSTDWLRGLKETIICGKLIPAGTSYLNYKNYLDTIYTYKL